MADLPSDLVVAGVAPAADEAAAAKVEGRWRGSLGVIVPAVMVALIFGLCFIWPFDRPSAVAYRRHDPRLEPAGVLGRPLPRDRCRRERRVVTAALRRPHVARDRARSAGDRPRARRPDRRHGRLSGRLARCHDHAPPRRGDRVSRARAGGGDRPGPRPERAAHDLGAVLLQRPGDRTDRAGGHPARARADVHDRRPPVGHELPAHAARAHRAEHPPPAADLRAAGYGDHHDPRGRAQLRRPGRSAAGPELGQHDRAGAEHAVRAAAVRVPAERRAVHHGRVVQPAGRGTCEPAGAPSERVAARRSRTSGSTSASTVGCCARWTG